MQENNQSTIYPCPISKGYGIPEKQAWLLLKVYFVYRLFLACLFISLNYGRIEPSVLGSFNMPLYHYSSEFYLLLTLISGFLFRSRLASYSFQAQFLLFSDIILLTLIMHACGGIKSGIGILLAVSVASGGVTIGGRCAMFFAAIASLLVLANEIYADITNSIYTTSYTSAGMLGAAFLTIALLFYVLAKRSENLLELATQHQQTIANLEELNHYIIQHLQTGIIITNRKQNVQLANAAALNMLKLEKKPLQLGNISTRLAEDFIDWQHNKELDQSQLTLANQTEIRVRFMLLPTGGRAFYMLILEDIALYNQHVQQSKLASLGRLTASIAHEIRNPLSAISHAGQLLSENPNFSPQNQRLTEIIQSNSKRVNQIIEDILQLSRRSGSRREIIQLKPWLTHYLQTFTLEHLVEQKTFRLYIEQEPLTAFIDPGHLKQILDNLCQNALIYGQPEQGPIILHSFIAEKSPCIEVIDNGPGIAREHLSHLFEPFFTTSTKGTGLGLFICKGLAELNQAKLGYYLTENKGSSFRLYLSDANKSFH
ncbi:ATP-binding protein [Methylomicrobium sp. Wu6]|uniref:sensor histidine kinase n=1 Tax=Methylomicrobium sp. Wu6 TaxID=3107928 RepID=UPI002DD6230B|nr:ATP-binding protein [Methylomicrobium sp. Wu6]MEC4747295.1 ATP-binding protein [Methylomicrobium sp. Wu6]